MAQVDSDFSSDEQPKRTQRKPIKKPVNRKGASRLDFFDMNSTSKLIPKSDDIELDSDDDHTLDVLKCETTKANSRYFVFR
jgi:hypothetical protein